MTEIIIIILIILIRVVTIYIIIIIERIRTRIKKPSKNHNTKIIIRIEVLWTAFRPQKFDVFVFICHYIGRYFYSTILKKTITYSRDDTRRELAASKKKLPQTETFAVI